MQEVWCKFGGGKRFGIASEVGVYMYEINSLRFMFIDIKQTGRDLVERCDVCGTASLTDFMLLKLLFPDVRFAGTCVYVVELEDGVGGAYPHPIIGEL